MLHRQYISDSRFLMLSDDSRLCFAEYGDPDGVPVLMLHGEPGSRLSWGDQPGAPRLDGVRLIAPDRPGYGGTDNRADAVARWPVCITALLDTLQIERVCLVAAAGGADCALACAWKIPQRLEAVVLFGAPTDQRPARPCSTPESASLLWQIAGRIEPALPARCRVFGWMLRRNPAQLSQLLQDAVSHHAGCPWPLQADHSGFSLSESIPVSARSDSATVPLECWIWRATDDRLLDSAPAGALSAEETPAIRRGDRHLRILHQLNALLHRLRPSACDVRPPSVLASSTDAARTPDTLQRNH